MKTLTYQKKLDIFNKWVSILGLDDWEIHYNLECNISDLVIEDAAGECVYNEVTKSGTIRILSEKEYRKLDSSFEFDFEKTLVHELLHLKFCLLDDTSNPLQGRVLHQLIDEMACALVGSWRRDW